MDELKIVDLYENTPEVQKNNFSNNIKSSVHVKIDSEKNQIDTDWIDKIEATMPYIENIFRNPNRLIVNEEEIVKIELARKITVDSIKHLSKHTNLIQDINKKTGDVRPSKILNINKEECYNTYENRLIYTLVQNIKLFVAQRKNKLEKVLQVSEKNEKVIEYEGKSNYKEEAIQLNVQIMSKANQEKFSSQGMEVLARIEKLEQRLLDVTSLEVYKIIDKMHIALVRPPIKKTNVVLKNVNFQYAVNLWNYLQQNMEDGSQNVNQKQDYMDEGTIKQLADEIFLLHYVVLNSLDNEEEEEQSVTQEKQKEAWINQMLDKIVDLESSLTEEQLKQIIGDKLTKIKYKKMATIEELQKIYMEHIDHYLQNLK